jgi:hypothetical protein
LTEAKHPNHWFDLHRALDELLDRLFDLTQLTVQVYYATDEATLKVTLPADDVINVAEIGQTGEETMPAQAIKCGKSAGQSLCAICTCPRCDSNAHWTGVRAPRWRHTRVDSSAETRRSWTLVNHGLVMDAILLRDTRG